MLNRHYPQARVKSQVILLIQYRPGVVVGEDSTGEECPAVRLGREPEVTSPRIYKLNPKTHTRPYSPFQPCHANIHNHSPYLITSPIQFGHHAYNPPLVTDVARTAEAIQLFSSAANPKEISISRFKQITLLLTYWPSRGARTGHSRRQTPGGSGDTMLEGGRR